jgi:hypothetical protein
MTSKARASRRIVLSAVLAAGIGGFASASWAEDAPTREQVEQLQKQLDAMQKEMEGMRAALEASEAQGGGSDAMRRHMHGMGRHWQGMHDQWCTMDPVSCPHMGSQPPAPR